MTPGFIVGTGRCGTSMLAEFLNAHSQICVPPELQIICGGNVKKIRLHKIFASNVNETYNAQDFIKTIENVTPHKLLDYFDYESFFIKQKYPITDLRQLLTDLYAAIAASRNKSLLFEQVPWHGQHIDILLGLFPQARFIHMIRDGRDVAISYARTPWWQNSLMVNLERWHREITKISDDAKLLLDDNHYLEIRYEDFVHEPERLLHIITEFIGVSYESVMLSPDNRIDYLQYVKSHDPSITSNAYNNWSAKRDTVVFTESVYGWKKATPEDFENIPAHIKATLSKFGYEI
jgi:hypothetical protein